MKNSATPLKIDTKKIIERYMINDGLTEMAANAVEVVVDKNTGIAYAVYLSSETSIGESSELVRLAKFNIMQPTNVEWVTIFNKETDFSGHILSECNILELDSSTVRVFVIDRVTHTYYYKDVDKKSLNVGFKNEVKFKNDEKAIPVSLNMQNINHFIISKGIEPMKSLNMITEIIKIGDTYYSILCGHQANCGLFIKSSDGATWTYQSLISHKVNFEAMLCFHDSKFWVMCRNGSEEETKDMQQNLMYSEDGINWTESNLLLTTSDTRPYLFNYQGDLYLAYSSPMPHDFSTVRPWRCNVHIGKIVSCNGIETFEEIIYKESKFGIVYYSLLDWYGHMIMLYSAGELHPTEGLMRGWSQGKDCLNYTILHRQEPKLSFNTSSTVKTTDEKLLI